jgi:hypothetical protein
MSFLIDLALLLLGLIALGWLVSGTLYLIGLPIVGVAGVWKAIETKRRQSQWRSAYPLSLDLATISPELVERWTSALRGNAYALDGSLDFSGDGPRPSEGDYDRAQQLYKLSDWLTANAVQVNAGAPVDAAAKCLANNWSELALSEAWREIRNAELLADKPELYWRCKDDATALEALGRWIAGSFAG